MGFLLSGVGGPAPLPPLRSGGVRRTQASRMMYITTACRIAVLL